jgi:hypothetical protein
MCWRSIASAERVKQLGVSTRRPRLRAVLLAHPANHPDRGAG